MTHDQTKVLRLHQRQGYTFELHPQIPTLTLVTVTVTGAMRTTYCRPT